MPDITLKMWHNKHTAKLTEDKVRTIRLLFKNKPLTTIESVAKHYKVTFGTIYNIKTGRSWRGV